MANGITSNRREQELEELKIANYNLTSNNSALLAAHATLQSQYVTLNKKHEELDNKFSKLQEYYCDGTNTSRENTCPLCKVDWIPFGSKCYFISTKTLTWSESRDWCLTKGGQLMNIEDSKEWDILINRADITRGKESGYWLGGYDDTTTRMNGEPVKSKRASDNYKGRCMEILLESKQDFRVRCETLNRWICESAVFPLRI
ncbi:natural killer cells antigen CD94-like [Polypterus senegalus]|uniref:natural killer cells antigen CD94-like n=1 Tax=Polypterus senegalus TaxID=55291 RepID=UPI0019632712|nr:natural killer cells antigen CD94-like [Polypterus senegalus]